MSAYANVASVIAAPAGSVKRRRPRARLRSRLLTSWRKKPRPSREGHASWTVEGNAKRTGRPCPGRDVDGGAFGKSAV